MADEREGFLQRWSRLKRSEAEAPTEQAQPPVAAEPAAVVEADRPPADDAVDPDSLPPIESLTRDSDLSVFMRPGVPAELKHAALRKLWRSDPVFANVDGLVEYGEDFSLPFKATAGRTVATLYRVGQGLPGPVDDAARALAEGGGPAVPPPDAPASEPASVADAGAAADDAPPADPENPTDRTG